MAVDNKISIKIAEAIKQSGLTQAEIAHSLGIGQQTVSEYACGKSLPALDTFAKFCEVLDLDANDILCIHEFAQKDK